MSKYSDNAGLIAEARVKELEAFVHSIAWGPPHMIEPLHYINSLVDKAQKLCPRVAEVYEFPQTKEKK